VGNQRAGAVVLGGVEGVAETGEATGDVATPSSPHASPWSPLPSTTTTNGRLHQRAVIQVIIINRGGKNLHGRARGKVRVREGGMDRVRGKEVGREGERLTDARWRKVFPVRGPLLISETAVGVEVGDIVVSMETTLKYREPAP
jgi:hypothetical protein